MAYVYLRVLAYLYQSLLVRIQIPVAAVAAVVAAALQSARVQSSALSAGYGGSPLWVAAVDDGHGGQDGLGIAPAGAERNREDGAGLPVCAGAAQEGARGVVVRNAARGP